MTCWKTFQDGFNFCLIEYRLVYFKVTLNCGSRSVAVHPKPSSLLRACVPNQSCRSKGLFWPSSHKVRESIITEKDLVKTHVFRMIYEVIPSTSLFQLGNRSSTETLRNDHTRVCPLFVGMPWIIISRGFTNNLTIIAELGVLEKVPVMYRLTRRWRMASLLLATVWDALSYQNIAPSEDETPTQHTV